MTKEHDTYSLMEDKRVWLYIRAFKLFFSVLFNFCYSCYLYADNNFILKNFIIGKERRSRLQSVRKTVNE
jgi:hypothetical protein